VPPKKAMTADAVKRLEAIEALEDLGIGFTLATHDLEIRGAGEILGHGQSGQIQEVGYSMYTEMLDRAVRALKAGKSPQLDRPLDHGTEIDLHVPALIPEDYLPDVHSRLMMYKRIASAPEPAELDELMVEMIDRFGLLPPATRTLFALTAAKLKATPLGIRKIDLGPSGGRVQFNPNPDIEPASLVRLLQQDSRRFRLDGGDKLRVNADMPDVEARLALIDDLLDLYMDETET
ncbi:MAG: transcription-repair coupling factor, partial [Pseudomonadales bacterium]|nr:transcription-repair coupling factor [Pseudomonadales bacterium]